VKQTLTLVSEDTIEFKIATGANGLQTSEVRAVAMFDNADVNRCPYSGLALFDAAGEPISEALGALITISDYSASAGKLRVDEEAFKAGTEPINLQLGMVTGFGTQLYKKVVIRGKSPCEASRDMKRTPDSTCTIDEEEDRGNEERGKECSSMASCYSKGYKNAMCPDGEHCAYWRLGNGKLYAGCLISTFCFKY